MSSALRRLLTHFQGAGIAHEGARFIVSGSTASAVNWLIRLGASYFVSFPVALSIGAVIGMGVGFFLYRTWVFPPSRRRFHTQTGFFLLVNTMTALFVVSAALAIAHALDGIPFAIRIRESIAHGLAIALGAGISFLGHRYLTFARARRGEDSSSERTGL